jgi:hypothetical protein
MDKFVSELGTLHWWLSVFAVGVLINIVSGPIGRRLNALLSYWSSKWRSRTAAIAAEYRERASKLVADPTKIEGERDRAMEAMIGGTLVSIGGFFFLAMFIESQFLILNDPVNFALLKENGLFNFRTLGALVMFILGMERIGRAASIYKTIVDARKQLNQCLDDNSSKARRWFD